MAGAGGTAAALLDEGRRRYEAGDTADAEPLALRALDLLPRGSDPEARAVAVQLAGECAYALGRYRDARALAEEALALRAVAPPEDRAESLNLRGICDLALGDAAAGHEAVAAALAMREAALGPDDPDTIESLNNTGVGLARLGRPDEAVAAHREALRRCERAFGGDPHRQVAVTCNALAVKLHRDPLTRAEADALYDRALAAAEAALGPEHPLVATLLANLATARLNAGDPAAAAPLSARAVDLHERRYGPDHPGTATALLTAALLAQQDGRLDEARHAADRALAIRLAAFGPSDPRVLEPLRLLVHVHGALLAAGSGDRADAMAVYGALRDLSETPIPGDQVRLGPADAAATAAVLGAYLARALPAGGPVAARRQLLDRARAAAVAADTALMDGRLDVAGLAAREAIDRTREACGTGAVETVEPLRRLAAVLRAGGDAVGAVRVDREARSILAAAYGERHPYVLRAGARASIEAFRAGDLDGARDDLLAVREALADAEEDGVGAVLRRTVDAWLVALERARAGETAPWAAWPGERPGRGPRGGRRLN